MSKEKILRTISDLEAELDYYYIYEPNDKESIIRLEKRVELEYIKHDEVVPRSEPFDSKMELYDEIGVPSSGTLSGHPIVTKMCEDLLKQKRKSND